MLLSKASTQNLGVTFDNNFNFRQHISQTLDTTLRKERVGGEDNNRRRDGDSCNEDEN